MTERVCLWWARLCVRMASRCVRMASRCYRRLGWRLNTSVCAVVPDPSRLVEPRIERVENALHGLDMATALRVLEYVRSRVIGNGEYK